MKQVTIYIRDDQFDKLQNEDNKSQVIRDGLDLYYNKEEDNMNIVAVVELNKNGIEKGKENNPVAVKYFDDNDGYPEEEKTEESRVEIIEIN